MKNLPPAWKAGLKRQTVDMGRAVMPHTQSTSCSRAGDSADELRQRALLYELLQHLPQKEMIAVCGICDPPLCEAPSLRIDQSQVLFAGSYTWSLRLMRHFPRQYAYLVYRRIVALARRHRVRRIYAHFPNSPFLIAGWQAAETLGLPLTVYFDILWEETCPMEVSLAQVREANSSAGRPPLRDHRVRRRIPRKEARAGRRSPAARD